MLQMLHILLTELDTGRCKLKKFISIFKTIINQLLYYSFREISKSVLLKTHFPYYLPFIL